jgi:RNA recognition motif-containing protein
MAEETKNPQHLLKGKSIQHLAGTGKPRKKPPPGYKCGACGADGSAVHWIYECPKKLSKKKKTPPPTGTAPRRTSLEDAGEDPTTNNFAPPQGRKMSMKEKVRYDPGANRCKIFVSGLPFGSTDQDIRDTFEAMGTISYVQRLRFKDKPNKCNGQAYVTFTTPEAAKRSIKRLDGKTIVMQKPVAGAEGGQGGDIPAPKKQVTRFLRVAPCRTRAFKPSGASTGRVLTDEELKEKYGGDDGNKSGEGGDEGDGVAPSDQADAEMDEETDEALKARLRKERKKAKKERKRKMEEETPVEAEARAPGAAAEEQDVDTRSPKLKTRKKEKTDKKHKKEKPEKTQKKAKQKK